MAAVIETLIEAPDNVELVRDKIALILLEESQNQQALANTDGKDPRPWRLRVFSERSNPWEEFQDAPENQTIESVPIVNVSWDSSQFDMSRSDIVERQLSESVFNIDCYGYATSSISTDGHSPGDEGAALEAQRAVRLVRNILMSAHYIDLGLGSAVWRRWVRGIQIFKPVLDTRPVTHVEAARLSFVVEFNEHSPQWVPGTVDQINVQVKRASNGEVFFDATYDHS